MTIEELKNTCEQVKEKFPTLLEVNLENEGEKNGIVLRFKDFSPKKDEEKVFTLDVKIHDSIPEGFFHTGKTEKMAEVFLYLGSLSHDVISQTNLFTTLTFKKKLQLFAFDTNDNDLGVVLRAYLDINTNDDKLSDELLCIFKEFLSYHFTFQYNQTVTKIKETLDDEEMIEGLVEKHRKTMESLLNPETIESL